MSEVKPSPEVEKQTSVGRHLLIADIIEAMSRIDPKCLVRIRRKSPRDLRALSERLMPNAAEIGEKMGKDSIPVISEEQEIKLIEEFKRKRNSDNPQERYEAERALKVLLDAFEPLLNAFAKKLAPSENDQEDLKQDARMSLVHMTGKYNSSSGSFINFTLIGIFREMRRWIKHRKTQIIKRKNGEQVEREYSINYSPISASTTVPSKAHGMPSHGEKSQLLTLSTLIEGMEEFDERNFASDRETPEEAIHFQKTREELKRALGSLSLRQETVLRMSTGMFEDGGIKNRYDEDHTDPWVKLADEMNSDGLYAHSFSLEEISEKIDRPKMTIREIQRRALLKIRDILRALTQLNEHHEHC